MEARTSNEDIKNYKKLSKAKLKQLLLLLDKLYRQGKQQISDREFDEIYKYYQNTFKEDIDFLINEEAVIDDEVGEVELSPFNMFSLEKERDEKNLIQWIESLQEEGKVMVSEKLDGISMQVRIRIYQSNEQPSKDETRELESYTMFKYTDNDNDCEVAYVQLLTRGRKGLKGRIVNQILQYVRLFQDLDNKNGLMNLIKKGVRRCILRGELIIEKRVFDKYLGEHTESKYPKPRNFVVALIQKKDQMNLPKEVLNATKIIFYECYLMDMRDSKVIRYENEETIMINSIREQYTIIAQMGFNIVGHSVIRIQELNSEAKMKQTLKQISDVSLYIIDGIVIFTLRPYELPKRKNPKYAFAFKLDSEGAQTKVIGITWRQSKSGVLTPVLQIEPVTLESEVIQNVTMHNKKRLFEMQTGIGAEIVVARMGASIPAVVEVVVTSMDIPLPEVDYEEDEVNFVQVSINIHFVINACLKFFDIKGIGPKIIQNICETKQCEDLLDFMLLQDMKGIDGMKDKMQEKATGVIKGLFKAAENQPWMMLMFVVYKRNVSQMLIEKLIEISKKSKMSLQDIMKQVEKEGMMGMKERIQKEIKRFGIEGLQNKKIELLAQWIMRLWEFETKVKGVKKDLFLDIVRFTTK